MEKIEKNITEYLVDEDFSLLLMKEEDSTRVFHRNLKNQNMKLIAKGPKNLQNADDEIAKVADQLMGKEEDAEFNEQKIMEVTNKIWKSCKSEGEFLTKLAYLVAGTIRSSYEEMLSSQLPGKRVGFPLDDTDLQIASLKAMHTVGEILLSAESRDGKVNAKANDVGPF
jgi:hypothetical protein